MKFKKKVGRTLVSLLALSISIWLIKEAYAGFFGPIFPCHFQHDGPFFGSQIVEIPQQTPDQIFPIYSGMNLSVYNSKELPNQSPIVVLKDRHGKVVWAIRADADSGGNVTNLLFKKVNAPLIWYGTVHGKVDSPHDEEYTNWNISRSGELAGYCYSW